MCAPVGEPQPWSSHCRCDVVMTNATTYLGTLLISLVVNEWCFSFPRVFQTTSYLKTTNKIIRKIGTLLELEGILKIIEAMVFTLQIEVKAR